MLHHALTAGRFVEHIAPFRHAFVAVQVGAESAVVADLRRESGKDGYRRLRVEKDLLQVLTGTDTVGRDRLAVPERQRTRKAVAEVRLRHRVPLAPGLLVLDVVRLQIEDELVAAELLGRRVAFDRPLADHEATVIIAASRGDVDRPQRSSHPKSACEKVSPTDPQSTRLLFRGAENELLDLPLVIRLLPEKLAVRLVAERHRCHQRQLCRCLPTIPEPR